MADDSLDQVNRVAITTAALVVIFVALLIVLLAWGAPGDSIRRLEDLAGWLRKHNDRETKLVVTLAALVVTLAMLTAIIVELTPASTRKMRVRTMRSGSAAITTAQVAERIEAEVRFSEHIAGCTATVLPRRKRIEVVLDLHVDTDADLASTADEACRRTQTLVERQLGLELAQPPRARLHYRELRLREPDSKRRAVATPGTPSEPATGWERPNRAGEGERDQRRHPDTPEEAQT